MTHDEQIRILRKRVNQLEYAIDGWTQVMERTAKEREADRDYWLVPERNDATQVARQEGQQ